MSSNNSPFYHNIPPTSEKKHSHRGTHQLIKLNKLAANKNINKNKNNDNKSPSQMDRFIPQSTSKTAYKASPSLKWFHPRDYGELQIERSPSPERLSSPEFFNSSTDHYSSVQQYEESLMSTNDSTTLINDPKRDSLEQNDIHRQNIAISLGFQNNDTRVYKYSIKNLDSRKSPILPKFDTNDIKSLQLSLQKRRISLRTKSHIPYRVLDAPCLRNDFYSNLVDWSKVSKNVIVGLGCSVYIWSESHGAIPILSHSFLNDKNDWVTCVSFCPHNYKFLIGTKRGFLLLFDQKNSYSSSNPNINNPLVKFRSNTMKGITCIKWLNNDKRYNKNNKNNNLLVFGEENGNVSVINLDNKLNELFILTKFQAQNQQVCGISLNYNNQLMAVGGNDNSCSLWDITDYNNPILKAVFNHNAAIKAVSFCPWSKSLLATGGGTKDKTIKFWHTGTGTLINQIKTSNQITSLIWSQRYKQIVATFGFGDIKNPILLTLYSYPKLEPILQVKTPTPLRALNSVLSPDGSSICVATTDETIRFYELWDQREDVIHELQEEGVYGSILIEHLEGITRSNKNQQVR